VTSSERSPVPVAVSVKVFDLSDFYIRYCVAL
jgi:hypothetical protein